MGTYQSGVGVQISTCRKKQKPQPPVQDRTCPCGSNTHMRRSSNQCPQRHWSKNEIDEFNRMKIVPSRGIGDDCSITQHWSKNEIDEFNHTVRLLIREYF